MCAIIPEERELVLLVRQCIQHHDNIPVGLASARASLAHECHAWFHALFMETGSPKVMPIP